ncbi:MAG TPA: DUF488 family protein [Myxococcales bacterium]|jgi:uncharacterized protein YeaO (DUF488 family)
MPVRTRRWSDPKQPGDGLRVLICRYRPRALPKADETWDVWMKALAPSKELLARFQNGTIDWPEYRKGYLQEMAAQGEAPEAIEELAGRVRKGKTVTLLCSKSCEDEARCHRTPLKLLVEKAAVAR